MSIDNGDISIKERVYGESKVDSNTAAKTPRDSELKKSSEEGTNVDGNDGCLGMDISIDEVIPMQLKICSGSNYYRYRRFLENQSR